MLALIKRELKLYFITPVAYIFTAIFILTSMSLTFYFGSFFSSGVADLTVFFSFIPWVFIFFISAVTMKSWSEEKRLGTIELLLTLPLPLWKIVLSKFFATWAFVAVWVPELTRCPPASSHDYNQIWRFSGLRLVRFSAQVSPNASPKFHVVLSMLAKSNMLIMLVSVSHHSP